MPPMAEVVLSSLLWSQAWLWPEMHATCLRNLICRRTGSKWLQSSELQPSRILGATSNDCPRSCSSKRCSSQQWREYYRWLWKEPTIRQGTSEPREASIGSSLPFRNVGCISKEYDIWQKQSRSTKGPSCKTSTAPTYSDAHLGPHSKGQRKWQV